MEWSLMITEFHCVRTSPNDVTTNTIVNPSYSVEQPSAEDMRYG